MAEAPAGAGARMVWGVDALVLAVADALATRFSVCVVRGEISGFSRASSGHCYFNLKDADGGSAMLRCAMFRRAAGLLDFQPADGQKVELRGRLGVYEPRGELQIIVESLQRAGAGALFEQFLRLKARLQSEGLFDAGRKRELPAFPRCIGVVSSLGAAALADVLTALQRRAPHVRVLVYPSLVQGPQAPAALCDAIAAAGRDASADVLLVCRGGGSLEDLWAFNDERVVRAIAAAPMPVVSGVGHESDLTLADLVADLRAPTPTAAAELAAPRTQDCVDMLTALAARLRRRVHAVLDLHTQVLDRAGLRMARPADSLRRGALRLDGLQQRLAAAATRAVQQCRWQQSELQSRLLREQRGGTQAQSQLLQALASRFSRERRGSLQAASAQLQSLAARLHALDPHEVLARGYAWLADGRGAPVQSVAQLAVGAQLQAVLADGAAEVVVTGIVPGHARE